MRGNAEFTVMKGFMDDFTIKEANPETLPPEPGGDVTDEEKLDNKADGKEPEKGKTKTDEPDLTMAKDVAMVEDGAKKDIKDGYVSDIQDETPSEEKGWNAFNEMVGKGIACDVEINRFNAGDMIGKIMDDADAEFKCSGNMPLGKKMKRKGAAKLEEEVY